MKKLIKRFGFALNGWRLFFKTEQNGQLQLLAAIVVVVAGFLLRISKVEWLFILLCIGLVLSLEMINSVIEKLVDHVHPDWHLQIKWVKDAAAGAVLLSAMLSAIIAAIIFIPKVYHLF